MFPGSTKAMGNCVASVPDVCKTPSPAGTIPIPYPNIGMLNQAVKTSTKVSFCNRPVVHKMSEMPRSMGDEAGVAGGVVSSVNMNKVVYKKGSSKILIEGKNCEYHTAITGQNGMNSNTVGAQVSPSQTKVMVSM